MSRLVILGILVVLIVAPLQATETFTLGNGMDVVLAPNHASPMIAAMVFVRAGSKFEAPHENGVTHFLEHLMFNGTTLRDQEHLEPTIEMFGGYINAFTRKELTGYLVLMPREYIDTGLAIVTDMLTNSILPAEKVEKERGIVSEEIRKDTDDPNYLVETAFDEFRYRGTPYARPVLGHLNIIATIPREDILRYYRTWYVPGNMSALIMGDFEPADMRLKVERYLGSAAAQPVPALPRVDYRSPSGSEFETRYLEVPHARLLLSLPAPHHSEADYPAVELWVEYLNSPGQSPFLGHVREGDPAIASDVSINLTPREEWSEIEVDLTLNAGIDSATALAAALEGLRLAARNLPTAAQMAAMVTATKAEEYGLMERLHYYGIMRAQEIVVNGWDQVSRRAENMAAVTRQDLERATARYGRDLPYRALYVAAPPPAGAVAQRSPDRYAQRVFPNGLVAIVKSNPDSRMLGAALVFRNRSASEPKSREGMVDFCQRLLDHGAGDYDRGQVSQRMAELGAEVTVADNPYIPYDDFYTSPQFSFLKFKALDESARDALTMLHKLVTAPRMEPGAVEEVRREMLAALGMQSQSASNLASGLLAAELFAGGPLAQNEMGSPQSIARIAPQDLKDFWSAYASPKNCIIAIATGADPETGMQWIAETFGSTPALDPPDPMPQQPPVNPTQVKRRHQPMEKTQLQIRIGRAMCGPADADAPALEVATRILSERLGQNLREKQGLAYSVGAGISFAPGFGWMSCRMGTASENYDRAVEGILAEIESLRASPPGEEEVLRARNQIRGQMLTRRLARENQCYYMALNELLGVGYDYDEREAERLGAVTAADVQRVAAKYFSSTDYYLVTVGDLGDAAPQAGMK